MKHIIISCGPHGFDVEFYGYENICIGDLRIDVKSKTAVVKAVDVHEDYQRQGIATELYSAAKVELIKRGVETLKGSLCGSGPAQIRNKVFGADNTKFYHGGEEICYSKAIKIMDVDYGYTLAETRICA